ncbi:MAG: alpha/beta fold hydrolase [Pseudonocardiaceae bacterium]
MTSQDGVRLALRVAGRPDAPVIVFLHGWAHSGRAWQRQLADPGLAGRFRLVAVDLRGHGDSDAPDPGAGGYADPAAWAADLDAVLRWCAEASATKPIVVGWSYGGLVIIDYLRVRGTAGLGGVVLVGAITEIGRGRPGGAIGPTMRAALPAALSADEGVARPALRTFVRGLVSAQSGSQTSGSQRSQRSRATLEAALQVAFDDALAVTPATRAALFDRTVDSVEVLADLDVPALIVHGTDDTVVEPRAAEFAAGKIQGGRLRWMNGVGHMPFAEAAAEFNAELLAFARGGRRRAE